MKTPRKDIPSQGRDLNLGPPEYQPRRPVSSDEVPELRETRWAGQKERMET